VPVPGYDRGALNAGIIHFGVGGFHRSRQAMYLDRLLTAGHAGDWAICAVDVLEADRWKRTAFAVQENGFWLADAVSVVDFIGPHVYPIGDDEVRQHYAAAWECELAGTYGRPVVLEEFGVSSDFASPPHAARYYRQVLNNSLLAGATGWIAWCNTDFELASQDPYRHHVFELHFGLTDSHGAPKPQLAEMAAFARALDAIDVTRCERAPVDAALVVPAYLDTPFPFTPPELAGYLHETLRQCYISARLADLPVALTRESRGIAAGARLYVLPSVPRLLAPTWPELLKLAHGGATVYLSYSAGPVSDHRGPSHDGLGAAFGVEHELRAGLADRITDATVSLTFRQEFGSLASGSTLAFAAAGSEHSRAYLPVRPAGAQVVAVDARGRPALLVRPVGSGSMVLCTYPIEHMAAVTPDVNPDATVSLYLALAAHAGVTSPVVVDDARVAADVIVRSDGTRFAWLVSQATEQVTVQPRLAHGLALTPLDGGARQDVVTVDPFGVSVLRLDDVAATSF
jgi:endo-1,4-beta-mannosidase